MIERFLQPDHPSRRWPELWCLTVSHHTAPPVVRERFSLDADRRRQLGDQLRQNAGKDELAEPEVVLLSTCNRTEIYLVGNEQVADSALAGLAAVNNLTPHDLACVHYRRGPDAVQHLCRVAAGLESVVLGETGIVQQLKTALAEAVAAETVGPTLHTACHLAFRVARRARTETDISNGRVSVASAGIERASRILGGLDGRHVVLLGAGQVGQLTVRQLAGHRIGSLRIVNRTRTRADELAGFAIGKGIRAESACASRLPDLLADADLLVTAVADGRQVPAGAMQARAGRDTVVLDLGMPPNVCPTVGDLPRVARIGVDDLDTDATAGRRIREAAVPQVEAIIREETARLEDSTPAVRDAVVAALYQRFSDIGRCEVMRQTSHGLPTTEAELDAFAGRLIRKLLAPVSGQLKSRPGRDGDETGALSATKVGAEASLALLVKLFALSPVDS